MLSFGVLGVMKEIKKTKIRYNLFQVYLIYGIFAKNEKVLRLYSFDGSNFNIHISHFDIKIIETSFADKGDLLSESLFYKFHKWEDDFPEHFIFVTRITGVWEFFIGEFFSDMFKKSRDDFYSRILRWNIFGCELLTIQIYLIVDHVKEESVLFFFHYLTIISNIIVSFITLKEEFIFIYITRINSFRDELLYHHPVARFSIKIRTILHFYIWIDIF